VYEREVAESIRLQWENVLREVRNRELDSNISIKLSQLGFRIDQEYCYQTTRTLVQAAAEKGSFVRIDMEDSSMTGATIELYKRLRGDGSVRRAG